MHLLKSNKELWFAIIVLAFFAYLIFRLSSLEQEHEASTTKMMVRIEDLEQVILRIANVSEKGEGDEVEQRFTTQVSLTRPEDITRGLYVLEREVSLPGDNGKRRTQNFTIYHIKSGVSRGDKSYNLNLGLAISGMTSAPVFYIDYTDSNTVNMDIMREFARLLPFGSLLAQRIDEKVSQHMYNAFLSSYREASYTGLEDIQSSGGRISRALWQFVEEQSGAIAEWISKSGEDA